MAMTRTSTRRQAEILREYGPHPGIDQIHGVTFDGTNVWFARGESIVALDPESGALVRELAVAADAGTAFDGKYLWQIAGDRIQKLDPRSGEVLATIPALAEGRDSGLAWAEGTLWVGEYRARKIPCQPSASPYYRPCSLPSPSVDPRPLRRWRPSPCFPPTRSRRARRPVSSSRRQPPEIIPLRALS
jgi:hypothetical protein